MTYNPIIPNNNMAFLPLDLNFKDSNLLIQLNKTNIALGRLNTESSKIPNQDVLIEFASIKEGVNSGEIENIHTTIEDAFRAEIMSKNNISREDKETLHYKDAIYHGFVQILENSGITINDIVKMNNILLENNQGLISSPNKHINGPQGIIYTPPQGIDIINSLLSNLEKFYNSFDEKKEIDPLLKLPMLHYQFEAIHPFGDGNGRIGRILLVLYLVLHNKIEKPTLFLSEIISQKKDKYYELLHNIDKGKEKSVYVFTLWLLKLIETQSYKTATIILDINNLIYETKKKLEEEEKINNIYIQEILRYLFIRPFYRISGFSHTLKVHRNTASKYLRTLKELNIIDVEKSGKRFIYFNEQFLKILKS